MKMTENSSRFNLTVRHQGDHSFISSVVDKHKDILRDYLEASKRNMQYHIEKAIANKNYNQSGRNRGLL